VPTYTPVQIAQEVLNQGGSKAQAWVAAALVDGIESSGDTAAKNPSSTACGLFQFLTTTWESNGGTKYAATACLASMQQQVAVFLTASAGNNFYPWAPDLGGSYNGNGKQAAATAPQPGSPVANKIASLASSTTIGTLLGNVPTNWADAGAATPGVAGSAPSTGSSSSVGSDLSTCVVQFPGLLFFSGPCILTKGGVKWLSGAAAMVAGTGVFIFGVVMLAAWGYDNSGAKQAVGSTARKIGIGTSLLTGQPEVAAGIAASGRSSSSRRAPRTAGLGPSTQPSRTPSSTSSPRTAGRIESWNIERRFRDLQRQQGPIGPRGANPTATRIAQRERRGTSVPGSGRPRTPEQRQRARERAAQPF
jgi:hypothetical protein